jgi:hypothetical protein
MTKVFIRTAIVLFLAAVLLLSTTVIASAATASQIWYLDGAYHTETGKVMEKTWGAQSGLVSFPAGVEQMWLAENAAQCDVTFPSGAWVIELSTESDWGTGGDKCDVTVGGWDTATGWYEISTTTTASVVWDGGQNILKVELQTGSATIYKDDYLALKIKNTDSVCHEVYTDGRSSVRSPDTDPGYPIPELTAAILIGLGLVGLVGYLGIREYKASTLRRKHS